MRPNWSRTSDVDGRLCLGAAGRGRLLALVAGEQLDDLLTDAVEVGPELHEDLGGDALTLADQAEQDVLGADVVVAELQGLAQRELEDLLGPRRERDVPARRLLALADDLLDLLAYGLQRDAERLQRLRRDALTLVDQAEEDVLRADVVVVEHPGLFLGQDDHPPRAIRKSLEHLVPLLTLGLASMLVRPPTGHPQANTGSLVAICHWPQHRQIRIGSRVLLRRGRTPGRSGGGE